MPCACEAWTSPNRALDVGYSFAAMSLYSEIAMTQRSKLKHNNSSVNHNECRAYNFDNLPDLKVTIMCIRWLRFVVHLIFESRLQSA